ncbi:SH3 domain-containing protein [[Candida] zeylanoides]
MNEPLTILSVKTQTYILEPTTSSESTSTITLTSTSTLATITRSRTSDISLEAVSSVSDFASHDVHNSSSSTQSAISTPSVSAAHIVSPFTTGGPRGSLSDVSRASSSTLGLAIGIPFAVVALLAIFVMVWYLIKRRNFAKRRQSNMPYRDDYSGRTMTAGPTRRFDLKKIIEKSLPSANIDRADGTGGEGLAYKEGSQKPIKMGLMGKSFSAAPQTVKQPEVREQRKSVYDRFSGLISPMLLKKFNLCHTPPATPDLPRGYSTPSLSSAETHTKVIRFHGDTPPLPPLTKKPLPFLPIVKAGKPSPSSSLRNMENVTNVSEEDSRPDRNQCIVIRDYVKALGDEVSIKKGDKISVIESHSDGWCMIQKDEHTTGMVPGLCLKYKSSAKPNIGT